MADEEATRPEKFDDYWLDLGRTMVEGTLEGLEKRHQKLLTFVNYVGGGSFLGGLTLATILQTSNPIVFGLFIIPILIILIVKYRIGIEFTGPKYKRMDLRSPIQIQDAHNELVDNRREKLRRAYNELQWAIAAVVLFFPIGIFYNNHVKKEETTASLVVERYENSTKFQLNLDSEQEVRLSFFGAIRDTTELEVTDPRIKWVSESSEVKKDETAKVHLYDADLEVIPELIKVEYEEDGLKKVALKAITAHVKDPE